MASSIISDLGVSMPSWVDFVSIFFSFLFFLSCQIWPTLVQEEDEYVGWDEMGCLP
jgi:hypothetical protein